MSAQTHDAAVREYARAALEAQAAEIAELRALLDRKVNEKIDAVRRALAAEKALATAREDALEAVATARKAATDYCWQRYKGRDPLNLKAPAVFTSHEWQKIGEAIDTALAALRTKEPSHG